MVENQQPRSSGGGTDDSVGRGKRKNGAAFEIEGELSKLTVRAAQRTPLGHVRHGVTGLVRGPTLVDEKATAGLLLGETLVTGVETA